MCLVWCFPFHGQLDWVPQIHAWCQVGPVSALGLQLLNGTPRVLRRLLAEGSHPYVA